MKSRVVIAKPMMKATWMFRVTLVCPLELRHFWCSVNVITE